GGGPLACHAGGRAGLEVGRPGAAVGAADLEEIDRRHVLGLVGVFGELGRDALVEELLHGRGHRYLQVRQLFAGEGAVSIEPGVPRGISRGGARSRGTGTPSAWGPWRSSAPGCPARSPPR